MLYVKRKRLRKETDIEGNKGRWSFHHAKEPAQTKRKKEAD
jgi:hypothetical protein